MFKLTLNQLRPHLSPASSLAVCGVMQSKAQLLQVLIMEGLWLLLFMKLTRIDLTLLLCSPSRTDGMVM